MSWALRRQILYILAFILFIVIFGFLVVAPRLRSVATCTDGRQNGGELGVDCGGSCARSCRAEVDDMSVLWSRSFEVTPGRYNAVAYIVNHNKDTAIDKINYRFRFADKDNLYIGARTGTTTVPPGAKFAVFEPGIDVGHSVPVYTSFEFTSGANWTKVPKRQVEQLQIQLSDIRLIDEDTKPVLSATLRNDSLFTIPEVDVVAILYDANGNATSVSRTFIEELKREDARNVSFTWPRPFTDAIVSKEIIPIYDIFSVKLK